MLNEQDKIKELFSKNLGNFEAPVNPAIWNAVASQIGSAAAVTTVTTSVSILTKVIIGAVACTVIGVASYFVFKENSLEKSANNEVKISQQQKNETLGTEKENIENSSTTELNNDFGLDNKAVNKQSTKVKSQEISDQKELKTVSNSETRIEKEVITEVKPLINKPIESIKTSPNVVVPKPIENIQSTPVQNQESKPSVNYTASLDKVPNVFSPDGDRINDELFIEYSGELKDFSVVIMDKDNKTIYQSQDPNFRWDGIMMSGEPAPKGEQRYVYIITARDSNGNKINKYSSLSIR